MPEIRLADPGLVENDKDGTSCFIACSQMTLRTRKGGGVPSFRELDRVIHRRPGKYSWEYGMLTYFCEQGFDVKFVSSFDLERLVEEGDSYMYEYFGKEAAEDQISNSDMPQAIADVRTFLRSSGVDIQKRVPQRSDISGLLDQGFYLIPYVNQRILQADPGYVAHTIFVYGYSERGVRAHNPGPPATEASELAWDLFIKAWSSPDEDSRLLFAVRPRSD